MSKSGQTLSGLDHDMSENKIGEIVNLSQKLNSIIWNEMKGGAPKEKILEIYNDVCKLAVLSGLEIDKAKRAYGYSERRYGEQSCKTKIRREKQKIA